jgi:hypothetical protein
MQGHSNEAIRDSQRPRSGPIRYQEIGKLADLAETFTDANLLSPRTRVVAVCRESNTEGDLGAQVRRTKRDCRNAGLIVVHVHRHTGSGYDPLHLTDAADAARRLNATVLVAELPDRFIRSYLTTKRKQDHPLTEQDVRQLKFYTRGLTLAVFHPTEKARSIRKRNANAAGKNVGGRPAKPAKCDQAFWVEWTPTAKQLRETMSIDAVRDELSRLSGLTVSRSSLHRRLK